MKTFLFTILIALTVMTAAAADVSGKWTGTFTPEEGDASQGVLILKQDGNTITGTGGPSEEEQMAISNGKIEGDHVSFEIKHPNGMTLKMTLVLNGDSLAGDVTADREDGEHMKAKLELKRVKS